VNIAPLIPLLPLAILSEIIHSLPASPLALAWLAWFYWELCLPYLMALIFTIAGLVMFKKDAPQSGDLDRLVPLGPVFLAMPWRFSRPTILLQPGQ